MSDSFDGLGALMKNVLAGPVQSDGPPWTHTFRPPELVVDSVYVTPVAKAPLPPPEFGEQYYRTVDELHQLVLRSAKPTFTGVLAYLADGGEQR